MKVSHDRISKTKVVIFIPTLRVGGAERVMYTIAAGLAERGYDIKLVTLSECTSSSAQVNDRNLQIDMLPVTKLRYSLPYLIKYLIKHRNSTLISALPVCNFVSACSRILLFGAFKHIVTVHSDPTSTYEKMRLGTRILYAFLDACVYRGASRIVCVSEGVKSSISLLHSYVSDKICCIYNPFELDRIRNLACAPVDLDLLVQGKIIVSVGRLAPEKNHYLLLVALSLLDKKEEFTLLIIGDGPCRAQLEELAFDLGLSSNVIFVGEVLNPFPYIKMADILVVSSTREGFCNVIVEGLCLGVDIISTDCLSGPSEILDGGLYGDLVQVNDPLALKLAIERRLSAPGAGNLSRAESFSHTKILDQYCRVLESVV